MREGKWEGGREVREGRKEGGMEKKEGRREGEERKRSEGGKENEWVSQILRRYDMLSDKERSGRE